MFANGAAFAAFSIAVQGAFGGSSDTSSGEGTSDEDGFLFEDENGLRYYEGNGEFLDSQGNEMYAALEISQDTVNLLTGIGDTASFGLTRIFRESIGYGTVDYDSGYYQGGQAAGLFTTPGAVALRGGAYLGGTRAFRFLNQNRYLRLGPGVISKKAGLKPFNYGAGRNIPMLRIGNKTPSSLNHLDLRVLGK